MRYKTDMDRAKFFDVIIIGAGGAGMMCAIQAGARGRKVLLLDHSYKLGSKILISGGGRCNFTNLGASPVNYVSKNPHFCKSALSRFTSQDFIQMVKDHQIGFHEKKLGQLFCNQSAQNIVYMLKKECEQVKVQFQLETKVVAVRQFAPQGLPEILPQNLPPKLREKGALAENTSRFEVETSLGKFQSNSLVIATGGLSIPKIGSTSFGYEIAKQFGLKVVPTAPALDGFVLGDVEENSFSKLSGISIDCKITCNQATFRENILFTHSGLSGPAALQASLYWRAGDSIEMDLIPDLDCFQWLKNKKKEGSRALLRNLLSEILPARFSELFCDLYFSGQPVLSQISDHTLLELSQKLKHWTLHPKRTVGYSKAEVTRGGVDTDELSSKTMESKKIPGLYFIGEVVDVTGWLGGYNFQWAWSSGWAAGQVV